MARTENGTARDNDVRDNDVRDNDVRDNDVRVETDVDGLTKDELYHWPRSGTSPAGPR